MKKACSLAKSAFDHAIAELDNLAWKIISWDFTSIIQFQQEGNLSLWTTVPEEGK